MRSLSATERIEASAFKLLEKHPEGVRWSELNSKIKDLNPTLHPKTINGVVWKLPEKYPDRITKADGLFRFVK